MAALETVKVEHKTLPFMVINKSDFNQEIHKIYKINQPDQPKFEPEKKSPGRPKKVDKSPIKATM
jgi:hypothetical protein